MYKFKLKNKFYKNQNPSSDVSIPITSLADIFIILLVFLLKGFVSGAINITPSKGLNLPSAHAEEKNTEALKVEVTSKVVLLESKPIYEFSESDKRNIDNLMKSIPKEILKAFEREREREKLIAQKNESVKLNPKIILIADESTPYSNIKLVLAAAATYGYTDFKLAVIQKE